MHERKSAGGAGAQSMSSRLKQKVRVQSGGGAKSAQNSKRTSSA